MRTFFASSAIILLYGCLAAAFTPITLIRTHAAAYNFGRNVLALDRRMGHGLEYRGQIRKQTCLVPQASLDPTQSRRNSITSFFVAAVALVSLFSVEKRSKVFAAESFPEVFEVISTESQEQPFVLGGFTGKGEDELLEKLSECDVVFLGEHHNRQEDHDLQVRIIKALYDKRNSDRPIAIGLEMVQQRFQPALDSYIRKDVMDDQIAEQQLFDGVRWAQRWQWPFEQYLPVFRLARERGIELVALNVDSETFDKVRSGGFESLSKEEKKQYVSDSKGFMAFSKSAGFGAYMREVIMPSYEYHARTGLLGPRPNPTRFYSSRILWDEAMSDAALRHTRRRPGTLMVVLEGADHVKFRLGSVARLERIAGFASAAAGRGPGGAVPAPPLRVRSVLLNPTPGDTDPAAAGGVAAAGGPATGQRTRIRLGLSYPAGERWGSGALPLSDYVWYSTPEAAAAAVPRESILRYLKN